MRTRTLAIVLGAVVVLATGRAEAEVCPHDAMASCTDWLVRGGGGQNGECLMEWRLLWPDATEPARDGKHKYKLKSQQECVDGDPNCDLDGCVNNRCLFSVGLCFWVDDPEISFKATDCDEQRERIFARTGDYADLATVPVSFELQKPRHYEDESHVARACESQNLDNLASVLSTLGTPNALDANGEALALTFAQPGPSGGLDACTDVTWTNHGDASNGCAVSGGVDSCDPFPKWPHTDASGTQCCTFGNCSVAACQVPASPGTLCRDQTPEKCSDRAYIAVPIPNGRGSGKFQTYGQFRGTDPSTGKNVHNDFNKGGRGDQLTFVCKANKTTPPPSGTCNGLLAANGFADTCCPCTSNTLDGGNCRTTCN